VPLRGSPLEAVISAAGMSNGQKAGGAGVAGVAGAAGAWSSVGVLSPGRRLPAYGTHINSCRPT